MAAAAVARKRENAAHKMKTVKITEKELRSMKTGGVVKKTCPHMLHKGEMVIPAPLVKHFNKILTK